MTMEWEPGFSIKVCGHAGAVTISANREGLLSLEHHLQALAEGVPGDHFHLDEHNSLEDGSIELIVELADFGNGV